ncbi:MAG: siroheme synthase CysG, partial [Gammaproteobacteria bacterium]|nr:siroheme synthase CysG [Gammaproteobacteria bacterium]NNM13467.1 uroporphyrinogen-III C-methyltransferase [Gammaproteobacteria bacterium]
MDYLPIFMQMHGRNALIIGGGVIASRKAALVQKSGANIHVVSPELSPAMQKLIAKNGFKYSIANYDSEFLDNKHLVIAATDNDEVNQQVFQDTNQRGIPCNVADKTELCSFILPAIVDRDPVVIAISTGGRSPVLARYIKARIETFIPTAFGKLADLLGRFRERVKTVVGNDRERRRFWEDVIDGAIGETVLSGNHKVAQQLLENEVDRYKDKVTDLSSRIGEVYLIGAGPGDPDLLTFRAQRLLQKADVVLYDRLVPSGIFELCRREAEMVYVGKRRDQHTIPQEELSKLLVRYARAGKSVARLKGGDPFVFGRGGEEIQELAKEGIPFQVVPGISAANGCAAYSGIPLTHREYASGVSFYTAHRKAFASDGNTDSNESILTLNWSKMIDEHHTSVFFMGLGTLKDICSNLIKHGLPDSFPAAMVAHGTTQAQKIEVGSLATLPTQVEQAGLTSPALLIVGKVVLLREELNWYASEYSGLKDGSE